ncbi:MAG: 6-hydroxymethylpterin diphosphokinase MptE-like protein, partial [Succinivibrio sp.]
MDSRAKLSDLDRIALRKGPLTAAEAQRFKRLSELQGRMSSMLIDRFASNIEAFRKFIPGIAESFEHYRPGTTLEFFCTENGIPNLMFPDRGNDILYKADNPLDLCREQVDDVLSHQSYVGTGYPVEYDQFGQIHHRYLNRAVGQVKNAMEHEGLCTALELKSCPNCVVVGVGLGYPAALLCERMEIANLVLIEPDPDIFFASLHAFDWASLLSYMSQNHYGINFLVGQTPSQLSEDLPAFYQRHGRFLTGQCLCFVHYASPEIQSLVRTLLKDYYRIHSAMGFFDDHLFGISHACWAATHHRRFLRCDAEPEEWFKSIPLFVVGNGPSLDRDIAFLRQNQDKALIMACGTALDTLYHAGIRPDFYACTERTPQIAETIDAIPDKDFLRRITLIAGDVVHPRTQERFARSAIFGKPDEPFFWMARAAFGRARKVRAINVMNPIVGNLGVSAAMSLGFHRVCLFGLDNGRPVAASRMHSKYSAIYSSSGVSDKGGNYDLSSGITLPGNFGGEVSSNYIFRLANRHMELVIGLQHTLDPVLRITNCSDGAAIDGAEGVESPDLAPEFSSRPEVDKDAALSYLHESMCIELGVGRDEIRKACMQDEFCRVCRQMIGKIEGERPSSRTLYVQHLEDMSELIARLNADPLTRSLGYTLDGTSQSFFMMALGALYHKHDEQEAMALADEVLEDYKWLLEDAMKLH